MTRVPIHFPLGGVSDDKSFSDQEQGTSSDANNVVGLDPITGRTRGGSREGMSKHTTGSLNGTNKVQDIVVVTRDSPKTVWANVVPPSVVEWVKQTSEGSTVHWVALDVSENVYILDGNGAIAKYNSDGVKLRTISVPVPDGHTLVRKIVVDADGGVYAASAKTNNSEGRVWRFRDSDVNGLELDLAWEHEITGSGVETIAGGAFFVLIALVKKNGSSERTLSRLDSVITGTPSETFVAEIPGPVNSIDVDPDGAVKLSIGANTTRGSSSFPLGFTKGHLADDLWNPHDLNNAHQRIHAWFDAQDIDGEGNTTLADDDEILTWKDRRQLGTTDGGGTYTPIIDRTIRNFFKDPAATSPRPGPRLKLNSFGDLPGVSFLASTPTTGNLTGAALQTLSNTGATDKANVADQMPAQRALFPGTTNAKFMTFIVFRPNPSQKQAIMLSQFSGQATLGGQDYGVLLNSQPDSGLGNPVWSNREGLLNNKLGAHITNASFGTRGVAGSQPAPFTFGAVSGAMILTIIHNKTGVITESVIRVNGVKADAFTFNQSVSSSSTSISATTLGCRRRGVANNPTLDNYNDLDLYLDADGVLSMLESFDGEVAEMITVLADSSDATHPHDVRITTPNALNAAGTGTVTQWEAGRASLLATEIELMEGYLAHKWRLAHLLPNGERNFQGIPRNHPFGGTGNWPVSNAVFSDDLDGVIADRSLWHQVPVIARLAPGTGQLSWAAFGGGVGHASKTSDDGFVFTMGAKVGSSATDNPGLDSLPQTDIIARCIRDRGGRYSVDAPARGLVGFKMQAIVPTLNKVEANPSVGTTITINDGTTTVVFTFVASGATGNQVNISTAGAATTMTSLITTINASALTITAQDAGALVASLIHDTSSSIGNEAITTTVPGEIEVYGMAGGESLTGVWNLTDATFAPDKTGLGVEVDEEGDFWVPRLTSAAPHTVQKLAKLTGAQITSYSVAASQAVSCVALPLSHPAYIDQSPTPTGPVFMYLGTSGGELDPQLETLHKIRLVSETQTLGGTTTARATRTLAASGGRIYEVVAGVGTEVDAAITLETASPYIFSTSLFNKVFWCDGARYLVYDSQLDTLEVMVSKASGSLPTNGRLIEAWHGRLLIARTEDDPHNVYMSRIGDPFNWDEFPVIADSLEAVSFGGSRVGRSSDIVNGMIPYNDDLLIIGGDHTIQRLNGDPNAGGQLDLISDITGMAYGRAWAKDPEGRVYFFGSRGGVYLMTPGNVPVRITRDRIERRMADVDLSLNQIRMAWDYRREGLRVAVVPSGQPTLGAAPASGGWFLDKNGAWWPYSQVRTDEAPTAMAVLDGDLPADRVVLIGGGDGIIRKIDESAVNDDGQRVASHVLIGPLAPSDIQGQLKFLRPQVTLGSKQNGCDFEWYASDTAEIPGEPVATGRLAPGQNPTLPVRARGKFVWLRLSNAAIDERFAFERASVDVVSGGRERV